MLYLKQSTASQSVLIGPFVDSTDGTTAETGLTIANTDIRLSKNGGNLAAKNSGGGTHDEAGWYTITLDATDTDTVGRLQLHCKMTGALMVHAEFQVLEEAIFDALFGASAAGFDANGRVDVASIAGTAQTARDIGASVLLSSGTGTGQVSLSSGTVTVGTNNDKTGYSLTATTGLGNQTANITGTLSGTVGGIAGTITTLDALDTAQDTQHSTTQSSISALNDLSAAQVNAEVVDALNTDTYAEPGQGTPGATISLAAKIGYLYKAWRNRSTQTSTTYSLYNDDATTVDQKATVSDNGTTADKGEVATGP